MTLPTGNPGMTWLSACTSHEGCSCANAADGMSAHRQTNVAMAGKFLIKRGQLNRTRQTCRESKDEGRGQKCCAADDSSPRLSTLGSRLILLRPECEPHRRKDAHERRDVIPPDAFAEMKKREHAEHRERDDLLDDLELRDGI